MCGAPGHGGRSHGESTAERSVDAAVIARDTVAGMARVIAGLGVALALALAAPPAHAESTDEYIASLGKGGTPKVRIAALLALTTSTDARAMAAMCKALGKDADAGVRLVAARSIGKALASTSSTSQRAGGIAALKTASTADKDAKVRAAATELLAAGVGAGRADPCRRRDRRHQAGGRRAGAHHLQRARRDRPPRFTPTQWPGGAPTKAQLTARGAKAFIVASSVTAVTVTRKGAGNQIGCTVQVRVAPWSGKDVGGGERWVADKAAAATGSATIVAATAPRATELAIRDCVAAVAEELTGSKIVPFLKKVAGKP
jgi:hypothetical protein